MDLLPSRQLIKVDIRNRFALLKSHGITTLEELVGALKTPDKIKKFSKESGLPDAYLAVLKREVASSQPKPVKLKEFAAVSDTAVKALEKIGIMDTIGLFSIVRTHAERVA